MKKRIVILSTADFDSPVWTNKQHLAQGLADLYDVVYIESLGLRAPTLSTADLTRIGKKAIGNLRRRWARTDESTGRNSSNIRIISPTVIPFHRYAIVRYVNQRLLKRQLATILNDADSSILWTFSPLTYGIEESFGQVVYHSVDLLHTVPKIPGEMLLAEEHRLIPIVDHVIASSAGVKNHLEESGFRNVQLWENVAQVDVFTTAIKETRQDQAVFAGNLTPSKIDVKCLTSILEQDLTLAIAGPIDIDGSGNSSELTELMKHPSVTSYGNLTLPELAGLLAESKVGVIPYLINDYTHGVFPMKVYEYLAAGLSVVSTPLPSLVSSAVKNVDLVDPESFGSMVRRRVDGYDVSITEESIAAAKGHSWEARIRQADDLLSSRGSDEDV